MSSSAFAFQVFVLNPCHNKISKKMDKVIAKIK
jgi:hypothetical protein